MFNYKNKFNHKLVIIIEALFWGRTVILAEIQLPTRKYRVGSPAGHWFPFLCICSLLTPETKTKKKRKIHELGSMTSGNHSPSHFLSNYVFAAINSMKLEFTNCFGFVYDHCNLLFTKV